MFYMYMFGSCFGEKLSHFSLCDWLKNNGQTVQNSSQSESEKHDNFSPKHEPNMLKGARLKREQARKNLQASGLNESGSKELLVRSAS